MSYLSLPEGLPDFSKAVISFWFRVPLASMTEIIAQRAAADFSGPASVPRMFGIIPLMTFGPLVEGYEVIGRSEVVGAYTNTTKFFDGAAYHVLGTPEVIEFTHPAYSIGSSSIQINPSHVGIFVVEEDGVPLGFLSVRLQMRDFGSGEWVYMGQPETFGDKVVLAGGNSLPGVPLDTAWDYSSMTCLRNGVAPEGSWNVSHAAIDHTALFAQKDGPESFVLGGSISITPDRWHHVLISFDLGAGEIITGTGHKTIYDTPDCTVGDTSFERITVSDEEVRAVTNPATMRIAVDDVDFVAANGISGRGGSIAGLGNNGVVPPNCYQAATVVYAAEVHSKTWALTGCVQMWTYDTGFGIATYSYTPTSIPCAGHEFGIPAAPALVDRILPVEMAELQFFTDVTLDTSVASNRRVFIAATGVPVPPVERPAKDEAGAPILDAEGNPVMDPPPAEKLLGKKPSILLHGSGNWIAGRNTGPEPDTEPPEKPADSFDPMGWIVQYQPDPSLNGPQSPKEEPVEPARAAAD